MIRILQTADVQVKVRNNKQTKDGYENTLLWFEQKLMLGEYDVYIISGDLFEYPDANDDEKELIFSHIARCVNIPSLKEIVIIDGNHDDEFSSKKIKADNNSLSLLGSIFQHIGGDLGSKVRYFRDSGVYASNITDLFEYVVYSIQDGYAGFTTIKNEHLSPDKKQLVLYHGMVKEFVDETRLPVRADIYKSLHSVEQFPKNSIILAGDIHQPKHYAGLDGQDFYYPGAPNQHTFGEGYYLSGNSSKRNPSPESQLPEYIEVTYIDSNDFGRVQSVTFGHTLPLSNSHITIEIDINDSLEKIISDIDGFDLISYAGVIRTFINVKSFPKFQAFEAEIKQHILDVFNDEYDIDIDFAYGKLTSAELNTNNTVVNALVAEKQEIIQSSCLDADGVISGTAIMANIDNLVLSNDDLVKMFVSLTEPLVAGMVISGDEKSELADTLNITFNKQVAIASESQGKKYRIELNSVHVNGFMSLGPVDIQLDIPGITRILGTNGIGKTNIFNLVRFCIRGIPYVNLDKSKTVQNNLLIFNNNDISTDTIIADMQFTVNDTPMVITRTITRIWKNNTTDEQKASKQWRNFVSSVTRDVTLKTPETTFSGDTVENAMNIWFGNTPETIMFINQSNISALLTENSDKLNNMALQMIGVDYVEKLTSNLSEVKLDLLSVGKPQYTKQKIDETIKNYIDSIQLVNNQLVTVDTDMVVVDAQLVDIKTKIEAKYPELLTIGDINQRIIDNDVAKQALVSQKANIFIDEPKVVEPFILAEPVSPTTLDSKNDAVAALILEHKNIETKLLAVASERQKLEIAFKTGNNSQIEQYKQQILLIKAAIDKYVVEVDTVIAGFTDTIKTTIIDKLSAKLTEITSAMDTIKLNIHTLKTSIEHNNSAISGGVCKACNRVHANTTAEHLERLKDMNATAAMEIDAYQKKINEHVELCNRINASIIQYQKHISAMSVDSCYLRSLLIAGTKLDCIDMSKYLELLENIDTLALQVAEISALQVKVSSSSVTTTPEYIALSETISKLGADIKNKQTEIDTLKDEITSIHTTYISELSEYQKAYSLHQQALADIVTFNNNIVLNKQQLVMLDVQIDEKTNIGALLQQQLPIYQSLVNEISELKTLQLGYENRKQELVNKSNQLKNNITTIEASLVDWNRILADYKLYTKNNMAWTIYENLIKNKFKSVVFGYYKSFLNLFLSELLDNVDFSLYWDESNELIMAKNKHGRTVYQPVFQASGMETGFLGLALVYTFYIINMRNSVNIVFIDELSGTLNTGEDLDYPAENYQELFVLMLSKFKTVNRFIVDHNIKNLYETTTYLVSPNGIGAKVSIQ